jgi:hypothetical protein
MTLTHAQIKAEVQELKQLLAEDKIEIPGFWQCYGPGVCLMLVSILGASTLVVIDSEIGTIGVTLVLAFFTFVITAITGSNLSLFYSLPLAFRQKSVVIALLRKKFKYGGAFYVVMIFIGCFYGIRYNEPMLLIPAPTVGYLLIMTVIGMDLSRYQLSAFTSVLHAVKKGSSDSPFPEH